MFLRPNPISKFIALLLFLFEVAVPVFAVNISNETNIKDGAQLCHTGAYQNLFSPLLLEELNENEEERDGYKAENARHDFSSSDLYHINSDIHHNGVSYSSSNIKFRHPTELFLLHGNLLI